MITYTRERIRLAIDVRSEDASIEDALTGNSPAMWRGTDLALEFGLFYDGELVDVAAFSSITAEVRDAATRTSIVLATRTLTGADLYGGMTQAEWQDGTRQHGVFTWTSDETRWDLQGELERSYWLVIHAITTDSPPRRVTLGATSLKVREDGAGEPANSPTPGDPTYLTAAQTQAMVGQVVRPGNNPAGMTIMLKSPNGIFGRLLGVGDDGQPTDSIVTL